MIKVRCVRCQEDIPSMSRSCPYCGYVFDKIKMPPRPVSHSREAVLFVICCAVVSYYFLFHIKHNKPVAKPVAADNAPQYAGACIVNGFNINARQALVRIDNQWFKIGDKACRGMIMEVANNRVKIRFPGGYDSFKMGEEIKSEK